MKAIIRFEYKVRTSTDRKDISWKKKQVFWYPINSQNILVAGVDYSRVAFPPDQSYSPILSLAPPPSEAWTDEHR